MNKSSASLCSSAAVFLISWQQRVTYYCSSWCCYCFSDGNKHWHKVNDHNMLWSSAVLACIRQHDMPYLVRLVGSLAQYTFNSYVIHHVSQYHRVSCSSGGKHIQWYNCLNDHFSGLSWLVVGPLNIFKEAFGDWWSGFLQASCLSLFPLRPML